MSEIEFKRDNETDTYKLLEINPRTWKWHSISYAAGIDFPFESYELINCNPTKKNYKLGIKWVHLSVDFVVGMSEIIKGNLTFNDY